MSPDHAAHDNNASARQDPAEIVASIKRRLGRVDFEWPVDINAPGNFGSSAPRPYWWKRQGVRAGAKNSQRDRHRPTERTGLDDRKTTFARTDVSRVAQRGNHSRGSDSLPSKVVPDRGRRG